MINEANGRCEASERKQRIAALGAMLDYALLEGADLRLPLIVYLLDMARIELTHSTAGDATAGEDVPPTVF